MSTWILIASIVAAVIIVSAIYFDTRSRMDKESAVLRNTIEVNLGILSNELDAIAPLIDCVTGEDKQECQRLITVCRKTVTEIELALPSASHFELGTHLNRTFRAMDSSSELHRLLIKNRLLKTVPHDGWEL